MPMFCGIDGAKRKLTSFPVGINGATKRMKEYWVTDAGVTKKIFGSKSMISITMTISMPRLSSIQVLYKSADGPIVESIANLYNNQSHTFSCVEGSAIAIKGDVGMSDYDYHPVINYSLNPAAKLDVVYNEGPLGLYQTGFMMFAFSPMENTTVFIGQSNADNN